MSVPSSTYRLQFGPNLNFQQANSLVSYLADLGVGALYASPLLQATPGSTHGYDVTDPTKVSADLGGEQERLDLINQLRKHNLGFVLDVVPNHMGIAIPAANPWWWDVLRFGENSAYASFFDIDWTRGPILIPVLADDSDDGASALTQIRVENDYLIYQDNRYPLAPGTEEGTPQEIHERQQYRLVSWRRGNTELNYRRFFDITTLAAVRVEDANVFAATHKELLRWVSNGEVTGLRIDHPDGLSDPSGYLQRLRAAAPNAWLVVEKILGYGETLPISWPVHGTTGYDSLREFCGVFIDAAGEKNADTVWQSVSSQTLRDVEKVTRRYAANILLRAEINRIAQLVPFPAEQAQPATAELLSAFPVYRSYLPEGQQSLLSAAAEAEQQLPQASAIINLLVAKMLDDPHGELATRIQQTSGMVTAKGIEDTTFYRYNRFVALNEVGGSPDRFGISPLKFHAAASARAAGRPDAMTTLSTHDTKRSEDVRARLAVLAEIDYGPQFLRWSQWHRLPEPTLNMLGWQTLVGAWPITPDRLRNYLIKAAKEAKLVTSWTEPNPEVDKAISAWPDEVLNDGKLLTEITDFIQKITPAGWSNSLGQKALQLAGPGVPDVYQGTELWDYSLVDPDNRRPVDFELRAKLLAKLDSGWLPEIDESGAAKLLITSRVLRLRRDRPELFTGYRPIYAEGQAAEHTIAFTRGANQDLVVIATRLPIGLTRNGGWRNTILPLPASHGGWTNVLTNEQIPNTTPLLTELLVRYPVAILVRR